MNQRIIGGKLSRLLGDEYEIIIHNKMNGNFNMDFDLERTMQLASGAACPMFRLYGWNPWTISLGANQKATDINSQKAKESGIGIVRRPTGGRAVYHADEVTYSIVCTLRKEMTIKDIYRDTHRILISALGNLGCSLDYERVGADFRSWYKQDGFNVSCFASSARYEVEWNGKKIVGSAQRVFGNILLQHGSILLGDEHEKLAFFSNNMDESEQLKLFEFIGLHSATVSQACGRKISYKEAVDAIINTIN
ncbi:MAG: hypothetical protein NT007_01830 [Candidatus Kapabacteria bacterium]|nr:hypothetical protein [Candidatus Kapabacteria bacterium]